MNNVFSRMILCGVAFSLGWTLQAQNPIVPAGSYNSDPSAHQWTKGGKMYVYGSKDEDKSYYCSWQYDVLSSSDLLNWTMHKDVFSAKGKNDEVAYSDELLFAPDCIYKDGIYYLYYSMGGVKDVEGVAIGSSPVGPFKKGEKIAHSEQIDPAVFMDDDGQAYLLWGQFSAKIAKLKPNMKEIDRSTYKDGLITEKEHHFHEGIQLLKRNGIYYLVFADISRRGMPTCIGYAMSKSIMGPYEYKGVIVDNFGSDPYVWNNHGSVAKFNEDWYVFYHRATNGSERMRKACIEPITFRPGGTIREVEMTTQGVAAPLNPFRKMDAERACYLTGSARVSQCANDNEELACIENQNTAAYKYFNFTKAPRQIVMQVTPQQGGQIQLYANNLSQPLLTTVQVPAGNGVQSQQITAQINADMTGVHPIYMRFVGEEDAQLFKIDWFKFE